MSCRQSICRSTGGMGYLRPVAQLNRTTLSSGWTRPSASAADKRRRWPRPPGRAAGRPRWPRGRAPPGSPRRSRPCRNPPISRTARLSGSRRRRSARGSLPPRYARPPTRGHVPGPARRRGRSGRSRWPGPPPSAASSAVEPAERLQLVERLPHADQAGAAAGRVEDHVGQPPAELLGQLQPHRLLALDPVRLLQRGEVEPADRAPCPRRRSCRSR